MSSDIERQLRSFSGNTEGQLRKIISLLEDLDRRLRQLEAKLNEIEHYVLSLGR
jgi:hypothetical protein